MMPLRFSSMSFNWTSRNSTRSGCRKRAFSSICYLHIHSDKIFIVCQCEWVDFNKSSIVVDERTVHLSEDFRALLGRIPREARGCCKTPRFPSMSWTTRQRR